MSAPGAATTGCRDNLDTRYSEWTEIRGPELPTTAFADMKTRWFVEQRNPLALRTISARQLSTEPLRCAATRNGAPAAPQCLNRSTRHPGESGRRRARALRFDEPMRTSCGLPPASAEWDRAARLGSPNGRAKPGLHPHPGLPRPVQRRGPRQFRALPARQHPDRSIAVIHQGGVIHRGAGTTSAVVPPIARALASRVFLRGSVRKSAPALALLVTSRPPRGPQRPGPASAIDPPCAMTHAARIQSAR